MLNKATRISLWVLTISLGIFILFAYVIPFIGTVLSIVFGVMSFIFSMIVSLMGFVLFMCLGIICLILFFVLISVLLSDFVIIKVKKKT